MLYLSIWIMRANRYRTLFFLRMLMQNCFDTINVYRLRSVSKTAALSRLSMFICEIHMANCICNEINSPLVRNNVRFYKRENTPSVRCGILELESRIDPPNSLTSFDWRLLDDALPLLIGALLGMQSAPPTGLRTGGAREVTWRRYLSTR